ncbi:MAG TPA: monofunctional biosynthetic peptidoglycan transglycosylase [Bacteroidales bacterium]|nr:monofunctional biosynthetic peptidoglycan transglycosylase [Bacteroidales bacterium]HPS74176.1 monofunctional biosynthetic peptidoglycan transglycosylase [Bacteroidales bacterium]
MKKGRHLFRRVILWFIILFFGSSVFGVLLFKFVNPPITPLMVIRLVDPVSESQPYRLKKKWVPLEKISPNLQLAVVASEDNKFTQHWGFDFEAIEKAQKFNERKKGKKIRGASTISQQTAKNVFLWPDRSWVRKGLEAYFTALIELTWSKERIMEVYLNVIETGKGIYGAEAASQIYFGKPAARLTRPEAALLAAILPNPAKWNPAHPTTYLMNKQQWILWNMGNIGRVDYKIR